MDAVIICVPTPLNEHHEPDLSYVTGTVESIAPFLHEGQLIVLESTTYPGTTEEVVAAAARSRQPPRPESGAHPHRKWHCIVAFSPEREDPGNETVARHDIPKVVGGCSPGRHGAGLGHLRRHLPPRGPGQQPLRRRDDQAA